jgi:indole-3-glycerol phosphate synthase
VPVIRKDFILDELQILEARAAGAAAVLLIVRALEGSRLETLLACAREYGLDALVEVHTPVELNRALAADARILGINSRDLDSFTIDTAAAWGIVREVPADRIAVAESGMTGLPDVERAADAGADAVLIGTALSASSDPDRLLAGLSRVPRRAR